MSSLRISTRRDGSTYTQILFREFDPLRGRKVQSSLSFDEHGAAVRWQRILDKVGPEETRRLLADEEGARVEKSITLATFAPTYIDGLTGASKTQKDRYRAYMRNDFEPLFGDVPLTSLCVADADRNTPVQDWISDCEADDVAAKTIANKHGFLSGCLKVAHRRGLIPYNPCEDSKLPKRNFEPCFLEHDEYRLLLSMAPERWRPMVEFLTLSCVRWSEFTALPVGALKPDPDHEGDYLCRVARAWKYTGTAEQVLGGPKTRKGVRTINVPAYALKGFDLDRPKGVLLVCTQDGGRISSQLFHNKCWRPLVERFERQTGKRPRVHDLRHTGASWMLMNGAEIMDVQRHLGHESAQTTTNIYGHFDRRSGRRASSAMSRALGHTAPRQPHG